MFWGFILTAAALVLMIVMALVQIYRVDRVIEQVDREHSNRDEEQNK